MDSIQFILLALFGCITIHAVAADCEWYCAPTPDGVECGLRCNFRKRSAESKNGIPCAFTTYDVDGNGLVTMTELDSVLDSVMKGHSIKATFYMMDRNDDGVIEQYEFSMGPLARRNCA